MSRFPRTCVIESLLVLVVAVGLTIVFWAPLWTGGGLIGSDIYAYFLPQKADYADALRSGELPLWSNRIGNGYPQLAESQTGLLYPLHLPLFRFLDLNTAYNASQLLHYVLAFVFTWMYARRLDLPAAGAMLAALVYTYGWFPPRICLEWAIVGGAWLPLALWCAESFLQTRWWRYAIFLSMTLGVQMLAGHFTLAFITQVTLVVYVPLRLWIASSIPAAEQPECFSRRGACFSLGAVILVGFLLAAAQLLPTWELKQNSQRESVSEEHDPGYGFIPARYLTQVALPWVWYADEAKFKETIPAGASRTNWVEAHLYFGLMPLALMLVGLWKGRHARDRRLIVWLALGIGAVLYATGVLLPITRHLPGFSFFEGPGRYGILTTLAVGLLAGSGLSVLRSGLRRQTRWAFTVVVFGVTIADLWLVSRHVTYAFLVDDPPIRHLADSPLRDVLSKEPQPVRLFSEGKNLPSLLGVATVPTYLGLGPAAYYDPKLMLPQPWPFRASPTDEQREWLRKAGVTHVLSFVPQDERTWRTRLVWRGPDPFLNAALARPRHEPFFLYVLDPDHTRGRVAWLDDSQSAVGGPRTGSAELPPRLVEYHRHRVVVEAEGAGELVLTDLAYPGWHVTVDGNPAENRSVDQMYRKVLMENSGTHIVIWTYRPASLYWGIGISTVVVLILAGVGHIRFWHPQWFRRGREKLTKP